MKTAQLFLSILAIAFLAACGSEVSCDDVDCDEGEYCVLYGSDTLAPSTTGCVAFPDECTEDETCACLDDNTGEGETHRFCLDFGCEDGAQVSIVCPGG